MKTRFLEIAWRDGRAVARGDHRVSLGHRIGFGADGDPEDGVFAEWAWDGAELVARNDRLGFYPLFWSVESRKDASIVRVSSSLLRLLAEGVDPEPDHEARGVFLRLGFYIDEDTPYKHIRVLPPNGRLRWREGRVEVSGAWPVTPPRDITHEQAIEGYTELFRESIRRRVVDPDRTAVLLTGGRDSRHILLELHRQGVRPRVSLTCRPYPKLPDEQPAIARALAEHCGVEHRLVVPYASLVRIDQTKNFLAHLLSDEGTWAEMLRPELEGRFDYGFDGAAGDNLSDPRNTTDERVSLYEAGRLDQLADLIIGKLSVPEPSIAAFVPAGREGDYALDTARERVVRALAACEGEANPVGRFFLRNRTRREISLGPYAVFAAVANYYVPYLDRDLYRLLASIPARALLSFGSLHTTVIDRAYPKAAHIPYPSVGAGTRFSGALTELAGATATLGAYAAARNRRRVPDVALWVARRLSDRRGGRTMPRRFLQYMIQLESMHSGERARAALASLGEL